MSAAQVHSLEDSIDDGRGTHARAAQTLPWVLMAYAAATLLHFAHNAQYLAQYRTSGPWSAPRSTRLVLYHGAGRRRLCRIPSRTSQFRPDTPRPYAGRCGPPPLPGRQWVTTSHDECNDLTEAAAATVLLVNVVALRRTAGSMPPNKG